MSFKVLNDRQINKLEDALNAGYSLVNVAATEKVIIYVLKK